MFLSLPIDLQHRIYDLLHLCDRIKLNVAVGKAAIKKTIINNPQKDHSLKYLIELLNRKHITKVDDISFLWRQFILANRLDPTVMSLCTSMPYIDSSNPRLMDDIINNNVELTAVYDIPKNIDLLRLRFIIAKYANAETFENLLIRNDSTREILMKPLLNGLHPNFVLGMFYDLAYFNNRNLLNYLIVRYPSLTFVYKGREYLEELCLSTPNINFVSTVVEACSVSIEKQMNIYTNALNEMWFDVADYLKNRLLL